MTPAQRLSKIVSAKNNELDEAAKAEFTIGAVFAVLVLGACFIGAFVVGLVMAGFSGGEDGTSYAFWFALPITLGFAVLATAVAWQTVQPKRQLLPLDDADEMAELLANGTPVGLFFTPKHELPGFVGFLFGGPENIFKGMGIKENKVSTDPQLHERAMKLLKRCDDGYELARMKNPAAAVLLRQLALVRIERRDAGQTLVFTDDGRALNDQS